MDRQKQATRELTIEEHVNLEVSSTAGQAGDEGLSSELDVEDESSGLVVIVSFIYEFVVNG